MLMVGSEDDILESMSSTGMSCTDKIGLGFTDTVV